MKCCIAGWLFTKPAQLEVTVHVRMWKPSANRRTESSSLYAQCRVKIPVVSQASLCKYAELIRLGIP